MKDPDYSEVIERTIRGEFTEAQAHAAADAVYEKWKVEIDRRIRRIDRLWLFFTILFAVLFVGSLVWSVAHASPTSDAIKACAPYQDLIADVAEVTSVPSALLTALSFKESSCDPNAENGITKALGIVQLLPSGVGEGYTREQLKDPVTSLTLGAMYLAKWRKRCGSWRGAVTIYNGSVRCSAKSRWADGVIKLFTEIKQRSRLRS